jgi:hypothetical protein
VADRLQAISNDADQFNAQSAAAQAAAAARELARRSYAVAERSSAQAQLGLSRAKAQRLVDTTLLYFALGETPVPIDRSTAVAAAATTPPLQSNRRSR